MYDHENIDALRRALIGRSVTRVDVPDPTSAQPERLGGWGDEVEGVIYLDDGTVLKLAGNEGGCACSAGDYELTLLNALPINGITDVQVEENPAGDDDYHHSSDGRYSIFVLAQDDRIELAAFEGNDGNGYYGTGFHFVIEVPA